MLNDIAVEFKSVAEKYDLEIVIDGKPVRESFLALQDISFSINKGESVAIVGPNGSGKSTLLRLIAGLLRPEKGEVRVNGRVGSLLDLTAGFHPELTGKDNLFLNASLYNFNRAELDSKYEQIIKFADIGKFINVPVRCYSQGMYVRLAFSLAIHVDPDILLIDDCLAVGDDSFRIKSIDKVLEFKAKNKTIVFVTHDFGLARQLCERGIYLKESRILKDAKIEEALSCYIQPFEEEKGRYKYLDAKVREEEEQRNMEREKEIERKREERERKRQGEALYWGTFLKLVFAPGRVRIFYNDCELTKEYGLQTLFNLEGVDISSGSAIWRVKKISDAKLMCFLKWPKPRSIFQIWSIQLLDDGILEWNVIMQSREFSAIGNERIEACLQVASGILDGERLGNKSRVIYFGDESGILLETLRNDQICGVATDGNVSRPYFLTVPDGEINYPPGEKVRKEYFKGRLYLEPPQTVSECNVLIKHKILLGKLSLEFKEGSCRILSGDAELTTGLGAYTSLYSKGIWYDSKQARWRIKDASSGKLIVEGVWPWIPVSQTWEIAIQDERSIMFKFIMKVFRQARIDMQETVLMLNDRYTEWRADSERKNFLEEFTCDDLFRLCLWAGKVDGLASVSAYGDNLPEVNFKPSVMEGYRIIVENAAHIDSVKSRVFHCLRFNQKDRAYIEPGEYTFFHGLVNIKEEQA